MSKKQTLLDIIYEVIDEINEIGNLEEKLKKSPDTQLYGPDGQMDSMSIVSMITQVEQEVEDRFDTPVSLTSEKGMSQKNSPFKSIKSLVDFIDGELSDVLQSQ